MDISSSSNTTIVATVANPSSSNTTRRRKKRMKIQTQTQTQQINPTLDSTLSPKTSWRSETTQHLYSSKLLQALRQLRQQQQQQTSSTTEAPPPPPPTRRSRAVRDAADKVLAMAARGRTRWSRAILIKRKIQFDKQHKRKRPRLPGMTTSSVSKVSRVELVKLNKGKSGNLDGVERKVKTLARLVPGCQKEELPVILEEATDYIPALEMQIRAMRDLLARLTPGEGSSSSSGSGGGEREGSMLS